MRVRTLYCGTFSRCLCLLLAIAIAAEPSAVAAQQPAAQAPAGGVAAGPTSITTGRENVRVDPVLVAAPEAGKFDVKYVTPQSVVYVSARPRQFLTSPTTELFPREVITVASLQELGFDPATVEEVVAFAEPPTPLGFSYGAVIRFTSPFRGSSIPEKLRAHTQPAELDGRRYLQSLDPQAPSLYMTDERTLLLMPDATLRRVLAPAQPAASPLITRVGAMPSGSDLYLALDVESLRGLINPWLNVAVMQQREKFPEEAKPFLEVPNLVTTIDLSINFSNPGPTALVVHANDAASAERLMQLYDLLKQLQRKQLNVETQRMLSSQDAIERAFGQYLERVSDVASDAYKIQRHDDSLVLFELPKFDASPSNQLTQIAVIGILVALLLPAVQAAREAARRNVSLSQLKQIILAMLVYADAKRTFPPNAIYSADGKPLLSWRVAILPYLEHQELYNQFKLDEPWDSPHNRQLLPQMPDVYANPNIAEPGWTNYLAVVGPQCVLDGTQKGVGLAQVEDGTSNTIVVVEADVDRAVEWTKPDDIAFDPNNPRAGLGSLRPDWFCVAWADGHASFVANGIGPQVLKAYFTRNGREVLP